MYSNAVLQKELPDDVGDGAEDTVASASRRGPSKAFQGLKPKARNAHEEPSSPDKQQIRT